MKLYVLYLFKLLSYYSGFASVISRNKVVILTYHQIKKDSITPEYFEKQIQYLSNKKNIISLDEFIIGVKKGLRFPSNSIIITFDDGFKDNYTNAYPILKRYNVPFTIFLSTDFIGSQKMRWDIKLDYIILKTKNKVVDLTNYNLKKYDLNTEKQKMKTDLFNFLLNVDNHKKNIVLSNLVDKLGLQIIEKDAENMMLSWEEVKKMNSDRNVSFGAHTCSHCKLTSVSSVIAKNEILESKKKIESEINKQVILFSYPYGGYGYFNKDTKKMLKDVGFECGLTTIYGNNSIKSDLFELRRIGVRNSSLRNYILDLQGSGGILFTINNLIFKRGGKIFRHKVN